MDMARSSTRRLHIGDIAVQCSQLELELRKEIKKLSDDIHEFANQGITESHQLTNLRQLLDFREAVLNWLQMQIEGQH